MEGGRARGRADVVGREPQKKRRREEEEELVAAKEESVMCVGSFVSRLAGNRVDTRCTGRTVVMARRGLWNR